MPCQIHVNRNPGLVRITDAITEIRHPTSDTICGSLADRGRFSYCRNNTLEHFKSLFNVFTTTLINSQHLNTMACFPSLFVQNNVKMTMARLITQIVGKHHVSLGASLCLLLKISISRKRSHQSPSTGMALVLLLKILGFIYFIGENCRDFT